MSHDQIAFVDLGVMMVVWIVERVRDVLIVAVCGQMLGWW